MALRVKAILNRISGLRIEGDDLNETLVAYAENNRDHFSFVYVGDVVEGDTIEAPAELSGNKYSAGSLKAKNKPELVSILETEFGVTIEGDATKDDLIGMILKAQD